jgi:hypothetical protein
LLGQFRVRPDPLERLVRRVIGQYAFWWLRHGGS